ncbi:hypothetical protein CEXT_264511 [Caerostris extrusa]|uniref:Uncharacterized protein n=1 Tax=Caerostris extrusa TaxID=172846 RepID=A0AAV4P5M1_CAEEX|nr:hypothetical protein CEXT_264511 [Caerostris extrusa]
MSKFGKNIQLSPTVLKKSIPVLDGKPLLDYPERTVLYSCSLPRGRTHLVLDPHAIRCCEVLQNSRLFPRVWKLLFLLSQVGSLVLETDRLVEEKDFMLE